MGKCLVRHENKKIIAILKQFVTPGKSNQREIAFFCPPLKMGNQRGIDKAFLQSPFIFPFGIIHQQ
jgi:hypothetical protein